MRVTQNMYSPNRFYLTFRRDNSWDFDEILNVIKKNIHAFIQIYDFSSFWLTLINLFPHYVKPSYVNTEWCAICTITLVIIITIIIIIIINTKNFRKRHFCGISKTVFKNKITFMKKAVLQTTTLMHCKARQVLRDLLVLTKEMAQK